VNDVVISVGGATMTGFHPGFWAWVFLHPWMTFFICSAAFSALGKWGEAFGKRKK